MDDEYVTCHSPIFKDPESYVKSKLKILSRDFYIEATEEEIAHLNTLKTQISIDNAILSIINHRWDK